jgi:hypothetical protein
MLPTGSMTLMEQPEAAKAEGHPAKARGMTLMKQPEAAKAQTNVFTATKPDGQLTVVVRSATHDAYGTVGDGVVRGAWRF